MYSLRKNFQTNYKDENCLQRQLKKAKNKKVKVDVKSKGNFKYYF